jgi:hypothetical protein
MEGYDTFVDSWSGASQDMKVIFTGLKGFLDSLGGVMFDFIGRPGISFSLRAKHVRQKERHLFTMIDVIDDDPGNRWLSVCFYGDLISDPEERGDLVPGGLLGEDGHCFDISEPDEEVVAYVKERLREACARASE